MGRHLTGNLRYSNKENQSLPGTKNLPVPLIAGPTSNAITGQKAMAGQKALNDLKHEKKPKVLYLPVGADPAKTIITWNGTAV
jgi:hypothetical protein